MATNSLIRKKFYNYMEKRFRACSNVTYLYWPESDETKVDLQYVEHFASQSWHPDKCRPPPPHLWNF
jgi:hypothetical protein